MGSKVLCIRFCMYLKQKILMSSWTISERISTRTKPDCELMGKEDASSIKHWPEVERPRERLAKLGGDALSDAQLLAILIGSGASGANKSAVDICRDLLKVFGSLSNLDRALIHELCKIKGIGLAKAAQIKAALEVGKRLASARSGNTVKMTTSRAFVKYFAPFIKNLRKEVVKVALLDNKLKIIKDIVISKGSVNSSIVHPREVMIPAIKGPGPR